MRVRGNQDDFGLLLGMARSSVRRAVASLVAAGAIRTAYEALQIVDADSLRAISREACPA
jgi:Crp-like helix-turn-helix domain